MTRAGMARTTAILRIGRWNSECSACGRGADPREATHQKALGYFSSEILDNPDHPSLICRIRLPSQPLPTRKDRPRMNERLCGWCQDVAVTGRATYCSTRCRVEAFRDRHDPDRIQRRLQRAFNLRHRADLMEKALRAIRDTPSQAPLIARSTLLMLDTMKTVAEGPSDDVAG